MKKILIIEDDPITSKIYSSKFEQAGYEVAAALNGEVGLQLIANFKPDLVQLDLMLPKVNGVEIIKRIRAMPEFAALPIIVLSNSYLTDMVKEAWKAGASKCLSKLNCSPKVVLDLIGELLRPPTAPAAPVPAPGPVASPAPPAGGSTLSQDASLAPTPREIQQEFLSNAPQIMEALRRRLQDFMRNPDPTIQGQNLYELFRSVHSLAANAGLSGLARISHLADVLEALLMELRNRPKQITPSSLRTIAGAVDCLALLFKESPTPEMEYLQSGLVLGVDDEPISRRMLGTALEKARLPKITLGDPNLALQVLAENRFDIIFLDVEMPGLSGFDLCKELRALPLHKSTPVVFVTSLSDFQSRARSSLSGGNELIAKPFLLLELAVKALTLIFNTKPADQLPPGATSEA